MYSPVAVRKQHLELEIVHVCFVKVGDSVLGALFLEFSIQNKLDEYRVSWLTY